MPTCLAYCNVFVQSNILLLTTLKYNINYFNARNIKLNFDVGGICLENYISLYIYRTDTFSQKKD